MLTTLYSCARKEVLTPLKAWIFFGSRSTKLCTLGKNLAVKHLVCSILILLVHFNPKKAFRKTTVEVDKVEKVDRFGVDIWNLAQKIEFFDLAPPAVAWSKCTRFVKLDFALIAGAIWDMSDFRTFWVNNPATIQNILMSQYLLILSSCKSLEHFATMILARASRIAEVGVARDVPHTCIGGHCNSRTWNMTLYLRQPLGTCSKVIRRHPLA